MTRRRKTNSHASNTRTVLQKSHVLAFPIEGLEAEELLEFFGPDVEYSKATAGGIFPSIRYFRG